MATLDGGHRRMPPTRRKDHGRPGQERNPRDLWSRWTPSLIPWTVCEQRCWIGVGKDGTEEFGPWPTGDRRPDDGGVDRQESCSDSWPLDVSSAAFFLVERQKLWMQSTMVLEQDPLPRLQSSGSSKLAAMTSGSC